MALYTTPDGRVVIGTGVSDGNDYHGYNGKRDIVIQLTEDGATTDGLNALEYLKSYAENAKAENKPIFPDGTRVFISTNGYTKAVEADDVVIDGENISIGGIVWNGSAWDFSNAGQSGGGSGGGVLVLTESVNPNYPNIRDLSESFATINAALIEGKSVILKSGNYVQGTIVGTYEDEYESGGQATLQYNVIATVVDTTNGSSQSLLWSTRSDRNPQRKIIP